MDHENGRAKDTDAGVRRVRARKEAKGEDLLHMLPAEPPPPTSYLKSHNLLWVLSDEREDDKVRLEIYRNISMKKRKEWGAERLTNPFVWVRPAGDHEDLCRSGCNWNCATDDAGGRSVLVGHREEDV